MAPHRILVLALVLALAAHRAAAVNMGYVAFFSDSGCSTAGINPELMIGIGDATCIPNDVTSFKVDCASSKLQKFSNGNCNGSPLAEYAMGQCLNQGSAGYVKLSCRNTKNVVDFSIRDTGAADCSDPVTVRVFGIVNKCSSFGNSFAPTGTLNSTLIGNTLISGWSTNDVLCADVPGYGASFDMASTPLASGAICAADGSRGVLSASGSTVKIIDPGVEPGPSSAVVNGLSGAVLSVILACVAMLVVA